MRAFLVFLVLLLGVQVRASAQEPAGASAYLIGVFDLRNERNTVLHIINPSRSDLRLFVAFFDHEENPLRCIPNRLSPNDLLEIDVRGEGIQAPLGYGVVKILTLAPTNEIRPQLGAVGNQRLSLGQQPVAETSLHPIQSSLLEAELPVLREICRF